ncbi:MAG: energy transducer TonB [Flavobacteriales bacterium]|nr:energy transducer TonB [Flavobacteriales bacterium]
MRFPNISTVSKVMLFVGLLSYSSVAMSQNKEEELMVMAVEKMPEYIGGLDSLKVYLEKNVKYPKYEKDNNIQGRVYVTFIVGKEGKVREARILRSVEGSINFDPEALRVVNEMPDWIPGMQRGKPVSVQFNLPINFSLKKVKKKKKRRKNKQ